MSVSGDEQNTECPLCMEPLELDDLNFFPCTCGYQICRFCWHRIRTDENGLCPACRKQYPEDPADFKPLTHEELQRIKSEKRQKDIQRKQKISDNRKHLGNVRVVQKNLVFVVGLSQRLAEPEVLKRNEYFGKFGKIHKVVINHSTSYAGSQGPSASAYVTYCRVEDSLRAIQAVNNIHVDGRTLKASLGTTKYCSHFLKGQQCPKTDCMYLHEIGDEAASFTKEEMQQGKHQEYEKKLHEQLLNSTRKQASSPTLGTPVPLNGNSSGTVSSGSGRDSESSTSSGNNSGGSANGEGVKSGRGKGQNKKEGGTNKNSKRTANSGEEPKRSNKAKSSSENQRHSRTRGSSKRGSSPSQKSSSEPSSSSVGDDVTVSDTDHSPNLERTSPNASPNPLPSLSTDPLPVNPTDDSSSSVGGQSSSLQTSTNGTQSPAQSLTNLDSSSSSAASSLSSSSTDVMQPFFSSRNGFSPLPEPNLLAPQLESTSLEWMCSSPTQDTSSVAQLEPVSTQGSTDWQAAFGFTSVQSKDDELGFDPWDESSKALADLMEKETHNSVPFCHPSSSSSSSSMLLNRNNLPYSQVEVVHPLRPLPTRIQHQQQQQQHPQMLNGARPIGAPPGFTPNHVGNSYNVGNQIPTAQHHQMQQQQQQQQQQLQQQQQQQQLPPLVNGHHNHHHLHHHNSHPHPNLHHPYSGESLLNLPKANHIKDIQGNQSKSQDSFNVKEWQDNLRPLFPNVNITFGSANGVQRQQPIPQHKGWSSSNSSAESSWLTQDPAVLSAGNVTTVRSDSPPHWMRSLQQLTEVDLPYNNHRLPVVNHYTYRNSQWTSPTQIPPPGFSNSLRQTHKQTEPQKMIDNF